jgi:signal peptidase I
MATAKNGTVEPYAKSTIREYFESFCVAVILALFVRTFVVQAFKIPTGSMENNLLIGDHLLVNKFVFGPEPSGLERAILPVREIRRGDIVVFKYPEEPERDFIKRVIGLPGDTVEVRRGRLILNGRIVPRQALPPAAVAVSANSPCRSVPPATPILIVLSGDRPTCVYRAFLETLPGGPSYTVLDQVDHGQADDFPKAKVPAGHVFLMGDNRDDSLDSRFPAFAGGIGMVPAENLIGRASFTFWSTDGSASYYKPWTWFTALRGSRIGKGYTGRAE